MRCGPLTSAPWIPGWLGKRRNGTQRVLVPARAPRGLGGCWRPALIREERPTPVVSAKCRQLAAESTHLTGSGPRGPAAQRASGRSRKGKQRNKRNKGKQKKGNQRADGRACGRKRPRLERAALCRFHAHTAPHAGGTSGAEGFCWETRSPGGGGRGLVSHRAVLPGLELSSSYCKGRGSRPDGRDVTFHLQPFPGPWSEERNRPASSA